MILFGRTLDITFFFLKHLSTMESESITNANLRARSMDFMSNISWPKFLIMSLITKKKQFARPYFLMYSSLS